MSKAFDRQIKEVIWLEAKPYKAELYWYKMGERNKRHPAVCIKLPNGTKITTVYPRDASEQGVRNFRAQLRRTLRSVANAKPLVQTAIQPSAGVGRDKPASAARMPAQVPAINRAGLA